MVDTARDQAIAEEQHHLDLALRRRAQLLSDWAAAAQDPAQDAGAAARAAGLRRRRAEVEATGDGLIFGRLDAADGSSLRLGRVGIPDQDQDADPLVVDWRADAARPFYTATVAAPEGVRRRRHVLVQDGAVATVDDELLTVSDIDSEATSDVVGEAALLRSLGQGRSGHMGSAVATLQHEQDAIVRAPAAGPMVVQGGPGTGKTVVGLHRVAYLLFTQPRIAARGVLVLGPNDRFLEYISQVLPALGESAVVSTTVADLVPGLQVGPESDAELARIKGRRDWLDGLAEYVEDHLPTARAMTVPVQGEAVTLSERRVAAVLRSGTRRARSWRQRRAAALEAFGDAVVDAMAQQQEDLMAAQEEGFEDILAGVDRSLARRDDRAAALQESAAEVDGVWSQEHLERLRDELRTDPQVAAAFEKWWPALEAQESLRSVLADEQVLTRVMPDLSEAERRCVLEADHGWTRADLPLLDALLELIGTEESRSEQGEFLAERAQRDREWAYGHVVVDEAQELSPMEWAMVLRRCPSRSITAVGDIDQTEAEHDARSWDQAVGQSFGNRWDQRSLTVCYRTPSEVMALTGPVLERAGSLNEPPRSIRDSGIQPRHLSFREREIADRISSVVSEIRRRRPEGSVGVVAPAPRIAELSPLLAGTEVAALVTPAQSKGLEWDAVVVVDPAAIETERRGSNALYVALTRCTQELVQVEVTRG